MSEQTNDPIRILHVVCSMNRGGLEMWLMHILRHIDRERFQMEFVSNAPGEFDEEIRSLGSQVHYSAPPRNLAAFRRSFRQILRQHGCYDVVHSHLHKFSGCVLRFAQGAGVHHRIAHSHNDESAGPWKIGLARRAYLRLSETLIQRHATRGLACSAAAAADLFGRYWMSDPRWNIHMYSMPFAETIDPLNTGAQLRSELGIASDAFVIGHVGRFAEQKNHSFLIDAFAAAAQQRSDLVLLLVGTGPLRPKIERRVTRMGIADRVVFVGVRQDVFPLMQCTMDGFLFPSFHEGCSLALVEAQAAGLPCVVTDTLSPEAIVVDELVLRKALSEPIEMWVSSILSMPAAAARVSRESAFQRVSASPFHIQRGVENLQSIYLSECNRKSSQRIISRSVPSAAASRRQLADTSAGQ